LASGIIGKQANKTQGLCVVASGMRINRICQRPKVAAKNDSGNSALAAAPVALWSQYSSFFWQINPG
jgi:hypothetical protein